MDDTKLNPADLNRLAESFSYVVLVSPQPLRFRGKFIFRVSTGCPPYIT